MSTTFPHMVWRYCEFRMQVWNVLHAASWKYRTQKNRQNSPSAHHRTTLTGCIFATKARIDNRKKTFKLQYLLHTNSQYGELRPTNDWDRSDSLGHPSKFQRVPRLGFVTAAKSLTGGQPNICTIFGRLLGCYTIYTLWGSFFPYNGILPGAKFTLLPSFAFFCVGRELSQRVPPIFGWAAITFGIGPHSSSTLHALP